MSVGKRALSALGKLGIIIAVAVAFLFGLAGTIYLSLRTSEVKVPDLVGKDFLTAESVLNDAGLNIRKRATRPTHDKPNIVLDQLPHAGEVVKVGQTVAVDVSRAPKEGEYVPEPPPESKPEDGQKNENQNGNQAPAAKNQNSNNQNKRPANTNKNANKNTNNSNNANANRNANNRNANGNSNANNSNNRNTNRNANTSGNRNSTNANANRRAPTPTTTPINPGGTRPPQR